MTPEELKDARRKLCLNQDEAAQVLGYGSYARISEIERGARKPGDAVVRLLQAYLDGYRPGDWPQRPN